MTRIATVSAPTVTRLAAGTATTPAEAKRAIEAVKPVAPPMVLAQIQPIAAAVMAAIIEVQAKLHVDPRPDHGADDQHGHQPPAVSPPPPVVSPPAPQPPVVQVPVNQPPAVEPPVLRPRIAGDDTAAARAEAMLDRQFADVALSTLARNNILTATAASRTEAYVGQAGTALSVLSALQGEIQAFEAGWTVRQLRV